MESQPQNNGSGFEILQRYHEGKLSPAERHALEKAALEDPFLAAALEGYAFTATAGTDVAELQKRLEAKTKNSNKSGLLFNLNYKGWLRIAAVFIVLLGAGWGSYQLLTSEKNKLAIAKDSIETTTDSTESVASKISTFSNSTADSTKAEPTTSMANKPVETSPKKLKKLPPATGTPSPEISEETALKAPENKPTVQAFARTANADISDSNKKEAVLFQGKVVDAKGNALPFATIASKDKQLITTTDLNGSFTLPSLDTNVMVTASAVGFQPLSLQLTAPAPNVFILPESASALNEVVVTALGKRNKKAVQKTYLESGSLEPAEGWQRFDDYIAQNIKPPENEEQKRVSGEVILAFEVSEIGEPVNIKVVNSLCASFDAEAIRLLKSGPKWKKGKKGKKGKVKIRF